MDPLITLYNRGNTHQLRKLKPVTDTLIEAYVLDTRSPVIVGYTENNKLKLTLRGDITISEGDFLEEAQKNVSFIQHIPDYGYIIAFEK